MKNRSVHIKLLILILLVVMTQVGIFKYWTYLNMKKFQVPVLMYHNIVYDKNYKGEPDTVTVKMFDEQMKYLYVNHYKTLTLDEFYCWKIGKCKISKKSVLLTFDDGFYSFHYLAEPILIKYNYNAVNFIIGSATPLVTPKYNAKKYGTIGEDLIKNHSKNVEYGSHSFNMHKYVDGRQRVYSMNDLEIQKDLMKMQKIDNFKYISYPLNTDTDLMIKILRKNNFRLAFRGEDEKVNIDCNNYQINRIGILQNYNHFKSIFETKKYNNKYGNGILRKVFVTIERKFKIKL